MTDDEIDTLPPDDPPTLSEILDAQTSRFLDGVSKIVEPLRAVVMRMSDELLRFRHEVRGEIKGLNSRLTALEMRVDKVELRVDKVEETLNNVED